MSDDIVEQAREIRRQIRAGEIEFDAESGKVGIKALAEFDYFMGKFTAYEVLDKGRTTLETYALGAMETFDRLSANGGIKRVKEAEDLKNARAQVEDLKAILTKREKELIDCSDERKDDAARIRYLENLLAQNGIGFTQQGNVEGGE